MKRALEYGELAMKENCRARKSVEQEGMIEVVHVSPSASNPEAVEKVERANLSLQEGNLWAWAFHFCTSPSIHPIDVELIWIRVEKHPSDCNSYRFVFLKAGLLHDRCKPQQANRRSARDMPVARSQIRAPGIFVASVLTEACVRPISILKFIRPQNCPQTKQHKPDSVAASPTVPVRDFGTMPRGVSDSLPLLSCEVASPGTIFYWDANPFGHWTPLTYWHCFTMSGCIR